MYPYNYENYKQQTHKRDACGSAKRLYNACGSGENINVNNVTGTMKGTYPNTIDKKAMGSAGVSGTTSGSSGNSAGSSANNSSGNSSSSGGGSGSSSTGGSTTS